MNDLVILDARQRGRRDLPLARSRHYTGTSSSPAPISAKDAADRAPAQALRPDDVARRRPHEAARRSERRATLDSRRTTPRARACAHLQARHQDSVTVTARPGDPQITPALVAEHGLTTDEYDRLVAMLGRDADLHRARDRQRVVERALLVQAFAPAAQDAADEGAVRAAGPGRERRRDRDRRRARRRVQDRVAQPSVRRRAVSGRGDGRRRHPARRLHDGRAADRAAQLAALRIARLARACATSSPAS